MKKKAVVLISGGMDSSVVMAHAISQGFEIVALSFDYGQRHIVELEAAKKQVKINDVKEHHIVSLNLSLFGNSSLLGKEEVPKNRNLEEQEKIPSTYVPARNMIFLSIAASLAESLGLRDIFIGVSSVDYSGYPDCRAEFIDSFEKTVNLGTTAADGDLKFKIHTPLIKLSKEETVKRGVELGVDFSKTHTCYDPGKGGKPCGECDSCILREKGFEGVKMKDPGIF